MLHTSQVFIQMGQNIKFSYLFAQKHAGNFEEMSLAGTVLWQTLHVYADGCNIRH